MWTWITWDNVGELVAGVLATWMLVALAVGLWLVRDKEEDQ